MKITRISPLFIMTAFYANATHAATMAHPYAYANTISAHNIATIQRQITNSVITTFHHERPMTQSTDNKRTSSLYGRMPMYGQMSMYGEYGDDTGIIIGHSGGDTHSARGDIRASWSHFAEDANMRNFAKIDTDYDIINLELIGGQIKTKTNTIDWGMFIGYTGATQSTSTLKITEQGGYIGAHGNYYANKFGITGTTTIGILSNTAKYDDFSDDYTNPWVSFSTRITYDIALDDTFMLRPEIFAGYTWVKSADYTGATGAKIHNDNFHFAEIGPAIRAIKQIEAGWTGHLGFAYVSTFANSANLTVDNVDFTDLSSKTYTEYSFGLEKSIDNLNLSANLYLHNGDRNGLGGGLSIRYIF